MKSILTAMVLVFSVGLLVGCGKKSASLTVDDVADLDECTGDQKNALDIQGDDENVDLGGIQGRNDPLSSNAQLYCASTEDEEAFKTIRDKELENRVDCKWEWASVLYYCRGEAAEEEAAE